MEIVGPSLFHRLPFFPQPGEVSGKDRWRNLFFFARIISLAYSIHDWFLVSGSSFPVF